MKFLLSFFIINLIQIAFESKKIRDDNNRIIGGNLVDDIAYFPFMASLISKPNISMIRYHCGASIIAQSWALTAAHCMDKIKNRKVYVSYNSTDWIYGERRFVNKRHIHPHYDDFTTDYDIALLHVHKTFPKKSIIRMVPSNYEYVANTGAVVLGWGKTNSSNEHLEKHLYYVLIKLQAWGECEIYHTVMGGLAFTERMFCAGDSGKDSCPGDSGGPIYQYYKKQKFQIGIVSWGPDACGATAYTGVYTELAYFRKWIDKHMRSRKRHH